MRRFVALMGAVPVAGLMVAGVVLYLGPGQSGAGQLTIVSAASDGASTPAVLATMPAATTPVVTAAEPSISPSFTISSTPKATVSKATVAKANVAKAAAIEAATTSSTADVVAAVKAALPLPTRLISTGGGTQLITAVTSGTTNSSRDGTLTWWQRSGTHWVKVGSTAARFGTKGLSDSRLEGDGTTPTGVFTLPTAFGIKANPGTKLSWHAVDANSWWDENSLDAGYNTWYENCPATICWKSSTKSAHSSEHLADYVPQYNYGVFIGFNAGATKVRPPSRPSGSGIFLHVNGSAYTAGCISVSQTALVSILQWLDPAASAHIAIGNASSIYRF